MKTRWKIVPVKSSTPIGYKWRWIKATEATVEECEKPFDYYYDCLVDAQKHGYAVARTIVAPMVIV